MSADSDEGEPLAEINVTPMVDVLLSLLIIFMVAQPKPANTKFEMNVPKDPVVQQPSDPNATLLVTLDIEGKAKVGQKILPSDYDQLVQWFKKSDKAQSDGKILVTGDDKTRYGAIIRVMAAAHEAEIDEVGIASKKL